MNNENDSLTGDQRDSLLLALKVRFEKNKARHPGMDWADIAARLEANPDRLWSLFQMEQTGGEPDVVARDEESGAYLFIDCSAESPKDRRSLCYDQTALLSRKENRPADSAMNMAETMGVDMLSEDQYRTLQKLGAFDLKTSSWVKTPDSIRKLGGALFCDRRYDTVFTYHNGADSYYAARGFRAAIKV